MCCLLQCNEILFFISIKFLHFYLIQRHKKSAKKEIVPSINGNKSKIVEEAGIFFTYIHLNGTEIVFNYSF
jgi:hypothetical protein